MRIKPKHWIVCFLVLSPSLAMLWALMTGAPAGHTGAFNEPNCTISGCHVGFALNDGIGSVAITGVPATFKPSTSYPITVAVNRPGQRRWGFELTARYATTGNQAGAFQSTDANVQLQTGSNQVQYPTHSFTGTRSGTQGPVSFSLTWISPANPAGRVSFDAAGNAANNNSQPSGDFIYTTSVTSDPEQVVTTTTTTVVTTTTLGTTTTTRPGTSTTTTTTGTTTTTLLPKSILYFPRIVNFGADLTGIAVANPGNAPATVTFTAYDNAGNIIPGSASGMEAVTNPRTRTMGSKSQIAELANQIFGSTFNSQGAWAKVTSDQPGLTGFYLTFDADLNVMDGTDVSDQSSQDFLIAELDNAEISLVNTANSQTALASISLVSNQGITGDTQIVQVPPNGRFSDLVRNMFSPGSLSSGGYLRVQSPSAPLVATEVFGSPGVYTAALNAMDISGGAKTLYCPQYAVQGGVWKTVLTLVNLEGSATTVQLQLVGDDAKQIGSTAQLNLPARGRAVLSDPRIFGVDPNGPLVQGYLRISSQTTRIAGYVRFGDPGDAQFQTALPFVTQGRNSVVYSQVAQNDAYFTGVAIINPNPDPASVTISVISTDGIEVGKGSVTIDPNARISKLLVELIAGLPPMDKGYFKVSSNRNLFSFGVFGTSNPLLSVLSAVPPQQLLVP